MKKQPYSPTKSRTKTLKTIASEQSFTKRFHNLLRKYAILDQMLYYLYICREAQKEIR